MRVLFVSRKWPPSIGGMETYCYELCEELAKLVELRLCVLPGRSDGNRPRVRSIAAFGLTAAWSIVGRPRDYEIVHGADMALWPLVVIAKLKSPRSAAVLSAHGTDVSFADRPGLAAAVYRAYLKLGARLLRNAQIIANSRATAGRARSFGFGQTQIVPLGCRPAERPPSGTNPKTVLFVGRDLPQKGLRWFIDRVLPELPEEISLTVAGPSSQMEEDTAKERNRVRWLGPVRGVALVKLMAEALCVVVPNVPIGDGYFEGFGLVALEAAAAGGVVLVSNMDGFTDSVIDGQTGILLAPMSVPAWRDAILDVTTWSPARRREFSERARITAAEIFTWERVARATCAIYERGLSQLNAE